MALFSHPADFTPVCTTEFIAFAKLEPEFNKRNAERLDLSIDSHHSHIVWVRNIKEKFDVDVGFPVIADLKMDVARAYGMVHPGAGDTSAVRATFMIDPNSILRAMVYYPMDNGRSIPKFIGMLDAMQTSDEHGVATPEGWQPGDRVIVPPAATVEEANRRMLSGVRVRRLLPLHQAALRSAGRDMGKHHDSPAPPPSPTRPRAHQGW